MSAALHLATTDDLPRLDRLVSAFHIELGLDVAEADRAEALTTLLSGTPHGAAYLIGPRAAPIGYVVLSMGFSVESGGLDCLIDEIFVRPNLRGRGIGTEALFEISRMLGENGVKSLYLEVDGTDAATIRLYEKVGFRKRDDNYLMAKRF